jgi:hypothetical protein
MASTVAEIVSSQSALTQTTSHTLSFTPSVSGLYRINWYADIAFVGGDNWTLLVGWTDAHGVNSFSGSAVNIIAGGHLRQMYSMTVKATSGNAITLAYTITAGTPSADMYLTIEAL